MELNLSVVVQTEQPRPRQAIEADLRKVEQQAAALDTKLRPVFNSLSIEEFDLYKQAIVEIEEGTLTLDQARQRFVSDTRVSNLFSSYENGRQLIGQQELLQKELVPYAVEDLRRKAAMLSSRVDFDAVMRLVDRSSLQDSSPVINTFRELFYLRRLEVGILTGVIETNDYGKIRLFSETLDILQLRWEGKGILSSEGNSHWGFRPEYGRAVAKVRQGVVFKIQEALRVLKYGKTLQERYHPGRCESGIVDLPLEELDRALNIEQGFARRGAEGIETIDYDPRLVEAADRYLVEHLHRLALAGDYPQTPEEQEEYREYALAFPKEGLIDGIILNGFVESEGKTLLITPAKLKEKLSSLFLPYFIKNIVRITAMGGPLKDDPRNPEVETTGRHVVYYDKNGREAGGGIYIFLAVGVELDASKEDKFLAEAQFFEALAHEVGHEVHNMLTVDEMDEWEQVMERDSRELTWYIHYAREKKPRMVNIEDFAESFEMFISNPLALYLLSQERFTYMNRLHERYCVDDRQLDEFRRKMESIAQTTAQVWRDTGVTEEDIRKTYLGPAYKGEENERN